MARLTLRTLLVLLYGIAAAAIPVPGNVESQRDPTLVAARRDARSEDPSVRKRGVDALLAAGSPGHDVLRPVLESQLTKLGDRIRAFAKSATGKSLRKTALARLEGARKAAMAAVFDAGAYYKTSKTFGQERVDELVGHVRALYEHPVTTLRSKIAAADRLWREAEFAYATADRLSNTARPEGLPDLATCARALDESMRIREHGMGGAKGRWLETVDKAIADAEAEASPGEIEIVQLLNAYRRMMGRAPLGPHVKLMRAARKHSQEMHDLGYFSHTSPTPARASPTMRARLEGYGGSCAENIARAANAKGAHAGWYGSPGHHRNMLGRHRVIGVGQSKQGGHWTQMFGGANPQKPTNTQPVDWRTYLKRSGAVSERDLSSRRALAAWAKRHGLLRAMEREAKLVLQKRPDDEEIRALLGETKVGGVWRHPAETIATTGPAKQRVKALASTLGSTDAYARVRAVRAIGNLFDPAAEPTLMKRLADPDRAVRIEAVHWLMVGVGPRVGSALKRLLRDKDPAVRYYAAAALYRRGNAAGVNKLLQDLVDGADLARVHAAEALFFLTRDRFDYAWDAPIDSRKAAASRATAWFAQRADGR